MVLNTRQSLLSQLTLRHESWCKAGHKLLFLQGVHFKQIHVVIHTVIPGFLPCHWGEHDPQTDPSSTVIMFLPYSTQATALLFQWGDKERERERERERAKEREGGDTGTDRASITAGQYGKMFSRVAQICRFQPRFADLKLEIYATW